MKYFWQLALRNLWVRKLRTLITASGILLGVAAMLAVSVMGASTTQSLREFFAQSSGRASLTISDAGRSGDGLEGKALARVRAFEGVADAAALTFNRVLYQEKDRTSALNIAGIDPDADRRLRTYNVIAGRFLSKGEKSFNIVLVDKFAANRSIALGDTISAILSNGRDVKFKVIGLMTTEGAGQMNSGNVGFINLEVAQNIFERGDRIDQIDLIAKPEIANDVSALSLLKARLQSALGANYVVALPAATGESVSQALGGLNIGLAIFSVIAVFVGMLLIYNTFAMTVAERTREIGMLRSLGATKRQILILVMIEAGLLGIVGTLAGIGGGLFLSIPLTRFMSNAINIPVNSFTIPASGLIQAALIGLVTTFVAAFVPAWQASRISPTEAMRARAESREGFLLRHSWKIGIALLALALIDGAGFLRIFQGAQFFMVTFLGMILIMPNLILALEPRAQKFIRALYGPLGLLGGRNLARAKTRTSLTVGVLMIGVVMNVAIGAMNVSFKSSIDDWINAAVGGDFFISSQQVMYADLARDLLSVEGIAAVTPERITQIKIAGVKNEAGFKTRDDAVQMIAVDVATYRQVTSFQFSNGETEELALGDLARGDAIFVSTTLSDRWNVKRGDTVRLRTAHGDRDFRVAAIVLTFYQGGQSIVLARADLQKYFGDTRVSLFIAKIKPNYSADQVQTRLRNGIAKTKRLSVTAGDDFRRNYSTQITQFFTLFDGMVWISVIVGALGVINTMTMNVLERVREIGTLRSIGMDRRQLGQMILSEAGTMGALGAVFGVLIAYPVSTVTVTGMREASGFPVTYVFPALSFFIGVIIALILSQAAALYPTWRAARVNVIEAIKEE
ncbi:MAG: ABC transporter permease [Chloroflexi bacterium]|nr:ABC transporter permease [Chloroflexota bacterium]